MSRVREDSHGLYVRTNGSIYRPQRSSWSYPLGVHIMAGADADKSTMKAGNQVLLKAMSGSPHCRLVYEGIMEFWHSHGDYLGPNGYPTKDKPSDSIWSPHS